MKSSGGGLAKVTDGRRGLKPRILDDVICERFLNAYDSSKCYDSSMGTYSIKQNALIGSLEASKDKCSEKLIELQIVIIMVQSVQNISREVSVQFTRFS